jgi:hypothetical protein
MSSLVINGDTSGSVTIAAPAVAGSSTITLPTTGGTMRTTTTPGTLLQVVNGSTSGQVSTSSNAYLDTGLTATITPTSATSKILVIVDQSGVYADGSNNAGIDVFIFRGATQLAKIGGRVAGDKASGVNMSIGSVTSSYLDSPATTSATTYKTQFLAVSNTATAYVQVYSALSTITLMEIAA